MKRRDGGVRDGARWGLGALVLSAMVGGAVAQSGRESVEHQPEPLPMSTQSMKKRSAEIVSHISASPEAVWRALSEARELEQWFPLEARVKPGVGGSVFTSWKNEYQFESPITVWEPNRHMRVLWCPPETPEAEQFGVDYFLHAQDDGSTVLRLVHFGFGEGPQWDEMYDGVSRGWDHMVATLKHYLERHAGSPRGVVYVGAVLDESARDEVWRRAFGAGGILASESLLGAKQGDRFRARAPSGEDVSGVVRRNLPGRNFDAMLDSLGDGVINVQIHRCKEGEGFKLQVTLSTWGLESRRVESMRAAWQSAVDDAVKVGEK